MRADCTKKNTICPIDFLWQIRYNITCCGMIAVKREVAGCKQLQTGFPWSECQVELTTSHCTSF
jgi:hypothetical protein